jgi:hypothetical protein
MISNSFQVKKSFQEDDPQYRSRMIEEQKTLIS